ncbi:MAG: molybdate ABC transporter substrate-binding protein [Thiohalocapsa sp.]
MRHDIVPAQTLWRRRTVLGLPAALAAAAIDAARAQPAAPVLVFAAASLKTALDGIAADWRKERGKAATVSYAASSTLAKQIANGAPADLFISADEKWMDYLQERQLIDPQSRVDLLGNSLVLIAPKDSALGHKAAAGTPLAIGPGLALRNLLGDGRLAVAETTAVPAGRYAKEALTKLGLWDGVADRLAAAENVRAALALVARGEAPLGIVYATDAAVEPAVRIVGRFPPGSHPPIVYPMALTMTARPGAAALATYLRGPAAAKVFRHEGFVVRAGSH